jgi:hypothetical protein
MPKNHDYADSSTLSLVFGYPEPLIFRPIRRHAIFAQVRTGGHFCRSAGDGSDFVRLLDYENSKKSYHEFMILGLPTAARMTKLTMSG